MKSVDLEALGNGTVLIYNSPQITYKADNTADVNVWVDNKAVGQLG